MALSLFKSSERIRGRALQHIRVAHFGRQPMCVVCQAKGKTTLATELDHITALVNGGADDADNRQGLCIACHADKTAHDMGYEPKAQFDRRGRVVW